MFVKQFSKITIIYKLFFIILLQRLLKRETLGSKFFEKGGKDVAFMYTIVCECTPRNFPAAL